jgi:hypothetical protein
MSKPDGAFAHLEDVQDATTRAASTWARADRAADDRAADLQGLEHVIALAARPVPREIQAAREAAAVALREACQAEGQAEHELKEAARRLLETEIQGE